MTIQSSKKWIRPIEQDGKEVKNRSERLKAVAEYNRNFYDGKALSVNDNNRDDANKDDEVNQSMQRDEIRFDLSFMKNNRTVVLLF